MKTTLKARTLLFCALVTLMGGLFLYVRQPQSGTVTVDIGPCSTQQIEERAALKRLSLELIKHPEAKSVCILAGRSPWRQGVMGFARVSRHGQKNIFWMDNRFTSSTFDPKSGQGIHATVLLSEEAIHAAARHSATFMEVNRYDERLRAERDINPPNIIPDATHRSTFTM